MRDISVCLKTICALLLAFCLSVPSAAAGPSGEPKKVRVGFFHFDGYHMLDEYGDRSGYGYEYLQHMAKYANVTYEYVGYDKNWIEMQDMLESGGIDLLTSAQKTEERQKRFAFSKKPIGTSSAILTIKAGNHRWMTSRFQDLDGIRVGLLRGNSRNDTFAAFARHNGFSYRPVFFEDSDRLIQALQEGEAVDAAVTSNLRRIKNEWVVASFAPSPFYIMVRRGDQALLDEIDAALEELERYDPGLGTKLFNQYYAAESGDEIAFTAEERSYIRKLQENGGEIPVMVNPDRAPFSYFEHGEAKGIIPEIMSELLRRAGLPCRMVETSSREEYRRAVDNGKAAVQLDARCEFNRAERGGYQLTDPYLESSISYMTRRDFGGEPRSIAALRDADITEMYVNRMYGQEDITYYGSVQECVDAILEGKADAVYFYTYVAQRLVYNDARNRLKETLVPKMTVEFAVAVRRDEDPLLYSIFNKAVQSVHQDEIGSIIRQETSAEEYPFSWVRYFYANPGALAVPILLAAAAVVLVMLYIFRRRRQALEQKQAREFERFIAYVCRANDNVIEIDLAKESTFFYHIRDGKVLREEGAPYEEGTVIRFIHPDERDEIGPMLTRQRLNAMIDSGGEIYFECRAAWKSDAYRWFACTLQGMQKDEDHPASFMIFTKDVDRIKREDAEKRQALKDALASARQASEAKGMFMSRMSHEIRTPLNGILGYITIAESSLGDREKTEECLSKSKVAARHLLNILNDVLDISAIESGRMKIACEPFDIRKVVSGISSIFYAQAKEKQVKFDVRLRNITREILVGDQLRLNQILMNLLSNAVKFTPAGGKVTLTMTQKIIDRRVHLRIEAADTGIGISEAYRERLFTPFEQQDATTARKFGGSGLGLSITKNLVQMMNGTIDVQSREGEGSTFIVNLSFGTEQPEEDGKSLCDFSSIRILTVYDEAGDHEAVRTMLERFGVQNDLVFSVGDAVRLIAEKRTQGAAYELCLLDWNLAGTGGREAVRRIHAAAGGAKPAVVIAAFDGTEIPEALKGEYDQVVLKPLFQSALFDLLVSSRGVPEAGLLEPLANVRNTRILLVEDNEMNLEIAMEILSAIGFSVDTASNGAEAVEKFCKTPPDTYAAVLMDIQMPVMDGYEAARRIRAGTHPQADTIPIIALTADAFAEDVNRALAAGMNDHVAKPIDFQQLREVLCRYTAQSRQD